MKAIVAVDEHWAIGYENQLLYHISEDLKRFKALTQGNVVVMGRKTLESLPGGKPLPNRISVVLSRNELENVVRCANLDELMKTLEQYSEQEIFVIGGEHTYRELLPYCEKVYVTKIEATAPKADAYFENLDELPEWEIEQESEQFSDGMVLYRFVDYKNNKVEKWHG